LQAFATEWCSLLNGDLNNDSNLDFFDIDPFLMCLFQGICW
jgi:hypothetical protein